VTEAGIAGKRRIRDYFARYRASFILGVIALAATQAFSLTVPQLLRIGTDALVAEKGEVVIRTAWMLIAVAGAGSIVRIASRLLIFNAGRKVEFDIRNDSFAHLMRMSPGFYQRMPLGQVMSRLVNDLTQVRLLLGPGVLNLTNTALVYAVVIPMLFATDVELAIWVLAPLPPLLLMGRIFAKRMYLLSREQGEKLGVLSEKVQENLSGVMTVRAYRREEAERNLFRRLNEIYLEINVALARVRGIMFPMMSMAGGISAIALLWVGGHRIAAGEMTVGQLVQFNAYLGALVWPTIALGWMISLWQRGIASMDRINEIFEAPPELTDGAASPATFVGRIELRGLTILYGEKKQPALEQVSTVIEPGETVVIVGKTGSGKSTLLKALARLLVVDRGQIFLDGVDIVDLPLGHVRGALGYAPQDAFLFSRSIAENVAFGRPEATDAEVRSAVQTASLDTDLAAFPNGLETIVGERGITLSGGQRQRTTLARAILVDAPILLLDDTLSAVDTETETKILEAFSEREKGHTIIVATHRLAFAARADRILVLDRGRLVEQGTERELLEQDGIYARMHQRQRLREELELESRPSSPAEDAA
jgi:ATP-binding cassette, subfamily B, multidrug efflux pump